MSEAPKLPPLPEREPPVVALVTADALPQIPIETGPETLQPRQLQNRSKPQPSRGGGTRVFLVLFVVALAAFALGIAVASAIVSGSIDLDTGWVKDLLKAIKSLTQADAS